MPIDYSKYPPNWKNIRAVVLARAGEVRDRIDKITKEAECEDCGLLNHSWYHRLPSGEIIWCCDDGGKAWGESCATCWSSNQKAIQIILTIAHLDHDADNHDVCVDRLRAWCQKCHLAYDAPMRFLHKDRKRGQEHLFPMENF